MHTENDTWEAEFPSEDGAGTYVSGVFPTLKRERMALQSVTKAAKRDPLLAMKESQENLIRICVRTIGNDDIKFADLRGPLLEKRLDAHQIFMLTELFDTWQTPKQVTVDSFLESVVMRKTETKTTKTKAKDVARPDG